MADPQLTAPRLNTWHPILTGWEAEHAWSVINAISTDLVVSDNQRLSGTHLRPPHEALLNAYLGVATGNTQCLTHAILGLNKAIETGPALADGIGLPLYGGICGLGWVTEHIAALLQRHNCSLIAERDAWLEGELGTHMSALKNNDLNEDTDAFVTRHLQGKWRTTYDLICGLVGVGVYFLERLPLSTAVVGLSLILGHLEDSAEETSDGIAWFTPPEFMPAWQRALSPNGFYNLGVAHGIPGIIYLLGQLLRVGIEQVRVLRLLEGAIAWVTAHANPAGGRSCFSSWIGGSEFNAPRMAWCYGDLGIGSILLNVADLAKRNDWYDNAHGVLDHCVARSIENADVQEAHLCHGAAGVGHMFNRLYQSQHDERFRVAASIWLEYTLRLRKPSTGIGGFSSTRNLDLMGLTAVDSSSNFLDGAAGIALAFLAAVTPVEPQWDRLLLLSGYI